jgi:hypothetical protein
MENIFYLTSSQVSHIQNALLIYSHILQKENQTLNIKHHRQININDSIIVSNTEIHEYLQSKKTFIYE